MLHRDCPSPLDADHQRPGGLRLPVVGLPPLRKPKPVPPHDYGRVRADLRDHGLGAFQVPAPYRNSDLPGNLPSEVPRLPPKPVADRLMGQYFHYVHHHYPIFHWPAFTAEYEALYQTGDLETVPPQWGALLCCIFGCGALYTLDGDGIADGKGFITNATVLYSFWDDEFTMDHARTVFLISLFLLELNLRSAAWVWLGAAVRIAQDLTLHVETGAWPPVERETRRRLWYCIYTMDRSASTGLPQDPANTPPGSSRWNWAGLP